MAENTFKVTICTPDGTVYDRDATMLVLSTPSGEMGILPNHIPLVAALQIDAARVHHDGQQDTVAVNGGFVEFANNLATIVADSAETPENIDVNRAQSAKERAEQHIAHAHEVHDKDELARAEVALKRAINRLQISKK
ncbi:F0F1 ATP synthase subunit epsilon [Paucilactobacillus sp. N302-9]|jgi:F-type H+-transporting ATPase subunit epsilon